MASPYVLSYANGKLTQGSGGSSLSTTLTVNFRDADTADQLRYTITPRLNDLGGKVHLINENSSAYAGTVSYLYTVPENNIKSLAAGAVAYQVFTVQATDPTGKTIEQDVVVSITGTNDAPVVQFRPDVTLTEGGTPTALNLLTGASDPDKDALSISDLKVAIGNDAAVSFDANIQKFLSLSNNELTIKPADGAFDNLAAGNTRSILLTYLVNDGKGGSAEQSQRISVTGVNDAPKVQGALIKSVTKGDAAATFNLLDGASDVDAGDTLSVQDLSFSVDGINKGGATPEGVSFDGTNLVVDPKSSAFSGLYAGQSQTIKASYTIRDNFNAFVKQTDTITISGFGTQATPIDINASSGEVSIYGSAKVGNTITANTASLSGNGFSYQWYSDNNTISTATNATYQVTSADVNHQLYVKVMLAGTTYESTHAFGYQ